MGSVQAPARVRPRTAAAPGGYTELVAALADKQHEDVELPEWAP